MMITQYIKKYFVLTLSLFLIMQGLYAQSSKSPWQQKGRIAISSDGNEHDDDDWSATPFSLAMLYAAGLQDKVCLYTYSDHIWGSNQCYPLKAGMCAYDQMKESALVGKALFNYKNTKFICAVDNAEVAYTAMCEEMNASSETNPLLIVAAGPMQVIGEALARSNKSCRPYITIISHSSWNNNHAKNCHSKRKDLNGKHWWDVHDGWTWNMMKEQFQNQEGGGVHFIDIKDQNGETYEHGLYCYQTQFDWVKTSSARKNPYYKAGSWDWLYSRLESCIKGKNKDCFDISDAGMIVYLLTGRQDNDAKDVKAILENPLAPEKW